MPDPASKPSSTTAPTSSASTASAEIEDDCKAVLAGYLDELAEIKRTYPGHFWK